MIRRCRILAYGRGVTNGERSFALRLCELLLDNETLRPFTRNLRRELWVTRIVRPHTPLGEKRWG